MEYVRTNKNVNERRKNDNISLVFPLLLAH